MSEGKIKINGVNYAYRWLQRTSPMRPTIICLHGFTGTSMSFSLPFQDLNVLAIDLIGHGKTDVYVHPYRYKLPLLVQDLAQLVLQLKIDAFYLLGYSMGARTALTWLIEQPKGILGIIMESGTPGISSLSERLIRQKKDLLLAQKIMTEPLSGFVDYWESIPLFESQKELPDSTRRKIRQGRLMQQSIGLALSLMYMGTGQQTNYWPKKVIQIRKIEQLQLKLPLTSPFETSYGILTEKAFDLLIIEDELGNQGVGELVSFQQADYIEETIDMSRLIIKNELIPLLTMSPIKEPFEVQRRLTKVQGNFMAKAALETAIWDLYARRKNVSFREIFKSTKTELAVGISLGIHTDSAKLLKQARMYVSQGYTRLKLKIKPDYDIEPLTLLRKEFPHLLLMADANSAYTLKDLPVLLKLDRLNLAMIEQPFNQRDFIEHAYLQKQLKTPICLDENIRTLNDVKTAHTLGSCRGINLKIPRVGGIAEALSIVTFCREHNLTVWLGGMFESGVGRCLNIQFASQNDFTFPGDISASDRYYYDDIIKNKACLTDGKLAVPLGKGNGAVLDQEKIERYCYKKELLFS